MKITMTYIKEHLKNQPFFFSPQNMRFFGQTLRSFKIKKMNEHIYKISAPGTFALTHPLPGPRGTTTERMSYPIYGTTVRYFDATTNEFVEFKENKNDD